MLSFCLLAIQFSLLASFLLIQQAGNLKDYTLPENMVQVEDLLDAVCEGKISRQIPTSLGARLQEKARSNEYLKYVKSFTQLQMIQTKNSSYRNPNSLFNLFLPLGLIIWDNSTFLVSLPKIRKGPGMSACGANCAHL